ncbi:MinD/ParA family protein [Oleiagrimonas sp. C23AA]|uniref:MinD/ParA family ATP-binding protein n=1 Tax=Oleiagrimonas sp. C23AA TaxID=2719047 RepID=UPI0031B69D60
MIAVAGGKGGVGKTCVSVNLGMTLSMAGHDVMLLDADLGLANIDVLLGLQPVYNVSHLLEGKCQLEDLILKAPHGLKIVPATSGTRRMAQLSSVEHASLIRAFDEYPQPPDFMIIDTAAGISDSVTQFAAAADEVIVVVCDEPASLTDAYALIKVLSRECDVQRFQVVANMVRSAEEGRGLFEKLSRVTQRFLDATLVYMGMVPHDEHLRQAIRRQKAVVDASPGARASLAFKNLAKAADKWETSVSRQGRIGFFAQNTLSDMETPA